MYPKYYLITHRQLKHQPPPSQQATSSTSRSSTASSTRTTENRLRMLSQGMPELPMRGELPQGVDFQQLMLSMDPSGRGLQSLYMNQMLPNGSPSPSSLPSSGAASTNGANNNEVQQVGDDSTKASSPAPADLCNINSLFSLLPHLNQNTMPNNMASLMEQLQNNILMNPLAAFQNPGLLQQLNAATSPTKNKKMKLEDHSPMKVNSPQSAGLNFGAFPFSMPPSTSTASSSQPSVIVNGGPGCDRDDATPPAQKRVKTESNDDDTNSAAAKILAGMGLPPGFPGLNFMLPGLQQPFSMQDFDPAAAIAQLHNTPKQPSSVKRQYSSNGKNYCDLCNKEVCNKYFLRTHMLKMHGIVIDENKTVIANIDTLEKERMGTLSFRCDMCMLELKSRNLLRQHKQEVHGVMPITSSAPNVIARKMPSTPTMVSSSSSSNVMSMAVDETKCPMCDRRISTSQLMNHIQNDHAGDLSQFNVPPSPTTVDCKFCSAQHLDDMDAQMHMIQSHPSEYMKQQLSKQVTEETDPSILRCKECQYSTRDPRNLEMHQERHERMNEAKNQPEDDEDEALQMTTEVALQMAHANQQVHKCVACGASYSDEASLDAHTAVAHNGLNLSLPKKDNEVEKTHERNSHTSGSISPSTESLPEGFGKVPAGDKQQYQLQSFILKTQDCQGNLLSEIVAQLPVKALLSEPTQVTFQLVPHSF